MRRWITVIVCGLVVLAGCSSSSSHATTTQPATTTAVPAVASTTTAPTPTAPTPTAPATPDSQVWLCKPGKAPDPCLTSETTAVIGPTGSRTIQNSSAAADPKIDCFYVYPTVSAQTTPNANLAIDSAEVAVATAQASRYSRVCRVFAPMYRQVTLAGLNHPSANGGAIAFASALAGWNDYLARYNDGRGVVLIGHSQGSFILRQLISKDIEPKASVRRRIVSAILLGGNVIVPTGKNVGGDFKYLDACRAASQTSCVIAYSSFDHTPPAASLFGRARKAGEQVLCTNPAALGGGSGALDPYFPTANAGAPATGPAGVPTAWATYPSLFTAQCENVGGASWLQINDVRKPGDNRPKLTDSLGPTWGLHLYDGNIALGNLVDIVQAEAAAWMSKD